MARIYNFAEFQIKRREDTHGFVYSVNGQKPENCPHRSLLFDENGHTIECEDCGKEVSAWWAFMSMVERFQQEWQKIETEKALIKRTEERLLTHKAAILVEDAWRKHKYIPVCPHCHRPILPLDKFGLNMVSKIFSCDGKPLKMQKAPEVADK